MRNNCRIGRVRLKRGPKIVPLRTPMTEVAVGFREAARDISYTQGDVMSGFVMVAWGSGNRQSYRLVTGDMSMGATADYVASLIRSTH